MISKPSEIEPFPDDGFDGPDPPEWLDIEKDIYVRMPRKIEVLEHVTIVDKGRGQPTIILPEEASDE
jgi:hypothetical protein